MGHGNGASLVTTERDLDEGLRGLDRSVRAYAASLGLDSHGVDDVAQETLTRVLGARGRLDPDAAVGYCLVVARNLVRDLYRREDRHRRHEHLIEAPPAPEQPAEVFETGEESRALGDALRELPDAQRELLLAHDLVGVPLEDIRRSIDDDRALAALAAQLARTRARMRVDYLLHRRGGRPLPTSRCRPVLLSLSAGDARSQQRARAGAHLLSCSTCSEIAPAVRSRRTVPWLVLPWAAAACAAVLRRAAKAASRPGPVLATASVVALAVTAVALSGPASEPTATSGSTSKATSDLTGPLGPLLPRRYELQAVVGEGVRADGVPVLSVPSDEGFWVGHGSRRIWVQLTGGGESPQRVLPGRLVWFRGVIVAHADHFAERVGVTAREGAAELTRQRYHVATDAEKVRTVSAAPQAS